MKPLNFDEDFSQENTEKPKAIICTFGKSFKVQMIHFNFVFSFDFCFLHLLDVEILQESCQEVQDFNLQEKLDDSGRANKAGVVSVFVHNS